MDEKRERPNEPVDPAEGVRIIGTDDDADATAEPTPPAGADDDVSMPHWTEPGTGEVPRIFASEGEEGADEEANAWSSFTTSQPRWRGDDTGQDIDEVDDFSDAGRRSEPARSPRFVAPRSGFLHLRRPERRPPPRPRHRSGAGAPRPRRSRSHRSRGRPRRTGRSASRRGTRARVLAAERPADHERPSPVDNPFAGRGGHALRAAGARAPRHADGDRRRRGVRRRRPAAVLPRARSSRCSSSPR